jgi:hypothetical protein
MNKVLIGADPETFVGSGSRILSAIGHVGGTKEEPRKVNLGALQEDNVLFEFNIDPAASLQEFQRNIRSVLSQGSDVLGLSGLSITRGISSHIYGVDELKSFGESAFIFGCDPDFNAWTGTVNGKPSAQNPGLRTAGGHIHIGYNHLEGPSYDLNNDLGKMCDIFLGLPSVLLDSDDRRRELYGKPGAIRHKPYGVEYRTLSNFWIFSDNLMEWAYESAVAAYEQHHRLAELLSIVDGDEVQRIINENDKVAARGALTALGVKYA